VQNPLSSRLLPKNMAVEIYKKFRVFSFGSETRTVTLREEQRGRVLQNRVVRRIFVRKAGSWRKLCNEEFSIFYFPRV
jgi:hypothetical protein